MSLIKFLKPTKYKLITFVFLLFIVTGVVVSFSGLFLSNAPQYYEDIFLAYLKDVGSLFVVFALLAYILSCASSVVPIKVRKNFKKNKKREIF